MKTNPKQRRGFTLVELLVVIVIIASLAALSAPMVMRQVKKAAQTEAISNAKQIGLAMFEFQNDYGSFPDSITRGDVAIAYPTATITGDETSSNGYFRQLFQAGITQSEEMFFAKVQGARKPDGNIDTNADALAPGEVGFGYILNGAVGLSTAGNPSRIIVCTPMADATTFDADPFDGNAVALKIDQSVSSLKIRVPANSNTGPAFVGTQNILAAGGFWGGITPTAVIPDARQ